MNRNSLLLMAAVVIALVGVCAYQLSDPDNTWSDQVDVENLGGSFSISYVTNGGVLPEDAPDRYLEGSYTDLPLCSRDGYFFEGWYVDEDLTQPLGAVTGRTSGDLTLYASWGEFSLIGSGFTMALDGTYYNGSIEHSVDGTVTWSYMVESAGGIYVETHYVLTYSSASGFHSEEDVVSGYWTDSSSDADFRYIGNEEIEGRVCEVWASSDGETQWFYRGMYPMKIVYSSGSTLYSYTLEDAFTFQPDLLFQPDVMAELPLDVTAPESVSIGDTISMTANGDGFTGWYVDGVLLSEERTITIERADPNHTYDARASGEYTVLSSSFLDLSSMGFQGTVGVFDINRNHLSDASGTVVLPEGFSYIVDLSASVVHYVSVFVDSERTVHLEWDYDSQTYRYDLRMNSSEVFHWAFTDPEGNIRVVYNDSFQRFYTTDDPYVLELVGMLGSYRGDMTDREFAEFVLSFVQDIPYISDQESRGAREFIKYPSETLWDGGGDCEDSSILYATLMAAFGYDSRVVIFTDHAMAGVVLDDLRPGDDTFICDGRVYAFAETTSDNRGYWSTWGGYDAGSIRQFMPSAPF